MSETNSPPPDPADAFVGEVLAGRYRILSKLGEGAMGAVYLGEHVKIGRRDAIKVLRRDVGQDAESMSRFVRGARNVSLIRHPNVCTIYDFSDTAEGTQFLAMEFIEGETLKDLLDREGRLEPGRALSIAEQVADALQAAHDVGVIHRDLKPANIMITRRSDGREQVKVVDFDIAKGPGEAEGEEVTRLGFVVGTPEYMSPEQLMGERLDGRSDLYSLAVVLFRMLTAALPFRATGTQEMMIERLTTPPVPLEEALPGESLPPQLGSALARALSRRREDRQSGTRVFADELRAIFAGSADGITAARSAVTAGTPPHAETSTRPATSAGADAELPATVVSPIPEAGHGPGHSAGHGAVSHAGRGALAGSADGGSSAGAAGRPATRRGVLVAAGVAAVAVIAAGAVALVSPPGSGADGVVEQQQVDTRGPEQGSGAGAVPVAGAGVPDADAASAAAQPAAGPASPAGTPGAQPAATDPVTRPAAGGEAPPARGARPALALAGPLAEVLDRQMVALSESPGAAALRAIADTTEMVWQQSTTRTDSAGAALTLAQAALFSSRTDDCRRWAKRAHELGVSAAARVLEACG